MSLTILFSACNSGTSTTTSPATYPYQFVVDSGSSGSRIYVYSKVNTESGFVLTDLYEKKTNTPLASFAANPTAAGTSIMPLLESAIQYLTLSGVTGVNTASIPTSVLGTAGMRLIPESSQAQIYSNVAESIAASGLMVGQVQTITGQYDHKLSNIVQDMIINHIIWEDISHNFVEIPKSPDGKNMALFVPKEYEGKVVVPSGANIFLDATCNELAGIVVPIPTLPPVAIVTWSLLFSLNLISFAVGRLMYKFVSPGLLIKL